jgi:dienelactone hydrolase
VKAKVIAREELEDHWREKVVIQSAPDLRIPCYLYIPKHVALPRPAILTLHGHGAGKIETGGMVESVHMHNYGWGLARRGYVTLCHDHFNMGERADNEIDSQFLAYAMGKSLAGMRTWDALRCFDYLRTRPEVMPDRIGLTGLSLGGTIATYAGALESRFRAVLIAGYFFPWRKQPEMMGCVCNYVPDLLTLCDLPEIDALHAPRPLMIAHGTQDWFFNNNGVRYGADFIRSVYRLRKAEDRFALYEFNEGHMYPLDVAAKWFDQWL